MEILIYIAVFIAVAIAVVAMMAYSVASWAYVIVKAWSWFFVTAFGMAPLTFVQGVAISTAIGVVAARTFTVSNKSLDTTSETYKKNVWYKTIIAMLAPWIVLGFCWLVKLFFI